MYQHQTIRRYILSLLNIFNKIKIQNFNSHGDLIEKNVPVVFFNREKSSILDHLTDKNMMINSNAIPRAYLTVDSMVRDDARIMNRNNKINVAHSDGSIEYQYNSMPFTFNLSYILMCRGHGEATQIIEEIVPIFNPTLALDIYDCDGAKDPTRILVKFLDVTIEPEPNEQYSSNLITLTFGFELQGWLYQPVKSTDRIKELLMRYHLKKDCFVLDYDVDIYPKLETEEKITKESAHANLSIKDIKGKVEKGMIYLTLDYTCQKGDQVKITWTVLDGDVQIVSAENDKCQLSVKSDFIIKVNIIDYFNNEISMIREYKV